MRIRLANTHDGFALSALLTELGYANTEIFIERRLAQLIDDRAEQLLIAEQGSTVLGFLSLHFIPQLALAGISRASAIFVLRTASVVKA